MCLPAVGRARGLSCLSPAAPGPRPGTPAPRAPGAAPCRAPKPPLILLSRPAASGPLDLPQREAGPGVGAVGSGSCSVFRFTRPRGLSLLEGRQQSDGESQEPSPLHGLSSALSSREPAWVQTCCRRMQGWGLSPLLSPPSCREAQPDTHWSTGSPEPCAGPARRCSQSRPDASTQRLAQTPQQGAAARASTQEKAAALWAFAVRPSGAAPPTVPRGGSAGRWQPSDPQDASSGCSLWGCVYVVHRAAGRAKGTKVLCVAHGDGGSTAWAALGCWPPVRGPGDQELGVGGAVERGAWLPKPRKSWKT